MVCSTVDIFFEKMVYLLDEKRMSEIDKTEDKMFTFLNEEM